MGASRQLNAFARISKFLKVKTKKLICRSFIMSNFDYCPVIWHFCGRQNNTKIEKIHNRALKIVYNDYDSEYDALLQRFGTNTVFQLRINRILNEVYKTVNKLNPSYLNPIFDVKSLPYALRDSLKLTQPIKDTTTFGLRSVSYVGSKLWNELPIHIKNAPDIPQFKIRLKNWTGVDLNTCESFFL